MGAAGTLRTVAINRHSRAGGNPVRDSAFGLDLNVADYLRSKALMRHWIPACAGMTIQRI